MPPPGTALERLGFLTIGLFAPDAPGAGHEGTLRMFELAEDLGIDSVYLRHRHLQYGVSSPIAVMAAASQRTRRVRMGTAVTPLGWENPLRLAEDLATVDVLSGGRLEPGFSTGPPGHLDDVRDALYPDTADHEDFTYGRFTRLLALVRGEQASTFSGTEGIEEYSARVEPHSPGLAGRLWCGAGSRRSARWAGEQGLNLLTSSVVRTEPDDEQPDGTWDFAAIQADQIHAFHDAHPSGRVSQGLVVIPTDSASAEQQARYRAYVDSRVARTARPQGPGLLFAPDLLGTSEEIAEALWAHAGFRAVREVVFALPFTLEQEDYTQIVTDMATHLGPLLGWSPGH